MTDTVTRTSIAILVCTCDRPELLRRLLGALAREVKDSDCLTLAVVVIDNGAIPVRHIAEQFGHVLPVKYRRLERSGLVVARNASLGVALAHKPEFLVFIDDDEVPMHGWLGNLVAAAVTGQLDIATGPVVPDFAAPPPDWAIDFFRKSGSTYCTSNLILRTSMLLPGEENWFNPAFNLTGGEDNEFLNRLARQGAVHGIAGNAIVSETIPGGRLTLGFVLRHGLRDGVVVAQKVMIGKEGPAKKMLLCLGKAAQKAGFGLNHLFWSLTDPARFYRAADDFAACGGILSRLAGVPFAFYGTAGKRREFI
ncbi:MAG: glycosyltransferase family 2 protein [Aestuariivirga sp.]|uniref:glycosyltransferase family A protein n=1 Tax=Aestuariivirga sp. TaxID=2650926 RepID=UPI0025BAC4F6|nr:glycosyltransferase family A protein [Aestuariivirga sp.]MCA3561702.1 glycosyltransferase family 2 protein [Aestuariivirga sp.]